MLLCGFFLGSMAMLAFFFIAELPTHDVECVLVPIVNNYTNTTILGNVSMWTDQTTSKVCADEVYKMVGIAALISGIFLPFILFTGISLYRVRNRGDVWPQDQFGIGIVFSGAVAGGLFSTGVLLLQSISTQNMGVVGVGFFMVACCIGPLVLLVFAPKTFYDEDPFKII